MALIPNFFLSFLPFFGEEYGWRCYLTPALQNRLVRGAVRWPWVRCGLVASAAEPVLLQPGNNLLQSIASQFVVCVTLGVFSTFAYEKCGKNIWVPILLHYLNNNMILVWTGTADISPTRSSAGRTWVSAP